MTISVDRQEISLSQNEFIMIFPHQTHSSQYESRAETLNVVFSPGFVNSYYTKFAGKVPRKPFKKLSPKIDAFVRENLKPDSDRFLIKACLYAVFSEITANSEMYNISNHEDSSLTERIMNYIAKNFCGKLTLKDVARDLGYNYQYLSRYFSSQFDISFLDTLNAYRLDRAAQMLLKTDAKIITIAHECGYDNLRTFNRQFYKFFSQSPHEFRKGKKPDVH